MRCVQEGRVSGGTERTCHVNFVDGGAFGGLL